MQGELNDHIFRKHSLRGGDGEILNELKLKKAGASHDTKGSNSDTNIWLRKFLDALDDESRELRDDLLWKWWSKDHLNMQNIRIEIIDILHFWISMARVAGMGADEVFNIYMQKNRVNYIRQKEDYCRANKDESDNLEIK